MQAGKASQPAWLICAGWREGLACVLALVLIDIYCTIAARGLPAPSLNSADGQMSAVNHSALSSPPSLASSMTSMTRFISGFLSWTVSREKSKLE